MTHPLKPAVPTLFTKPNCVQCDTTKRKLAKHGIVLQVIDITEDPLALEFILELDYKQVPVVWVSPDVHWSGYRGDLIETHLMKEHAA